MLETILRSLTPNRPIAARLYLVYAVASVAIFVTAWQLVGGALPGPGDVLHALHRLWAEQGLCAQLATSLWLNVEAMLWASALALGLAYATVVPAMRPVVAAISKLRFTGMVGWAFVFTLWARDGHQLKLWMLVFGIAPFFLTQMAAVIADLPRERFEHARTLGLGEWRIAWDVVVRGTLDQALEALRQSAAIGWMMLTMVEGVSRAEGGIGALLLNENKHLELDAVFALILVVLLVGVAQDYALGWLRRAACPYAVLEKDRR
jgi:NitT/TauT family transport system permease protein